MIEVRVAGQGRVTGDTVTSDAEQEATCTLCGTATDTVASITPEPSASFACKDCLRLRLEAMTLASWMVKPKTALPWGQVTS